MYILKDKSVTKMCKNVIKKGKYNLENKHKPSQQLLNFPLHDSEQKLQWLLA